MTKDSEDDGLLKFDESYSLIEGISDSESEASAANDDNESQHEVQEVLSDEFYDLLMGTMQECLDADCDNSGDEDAPADDLSVIKEKLQETVQEVAVAAEEVVEVVQHKWEALTEEDWKEFSDEDSVFDYIALKIRESLSSN